MVDAATRNAQLQEQAREAGNKSILEGLQGIGQMGQSLVDTKKRVAQSLAIGRHLGVPDDVARVLEPSEVLSAANAKNKMPDALAAALLINPSLAKDPAFIGMLQSMVPTQPQPLAPITTPAPSKTQPASRQPPQAPTGLPMPVVAPPPMPPTPPTVSSSSATATSPNALITNLLGKPMTGATANLAMKMSAMNKQEPVFTRDEAHTRGSVPHGSHILPEEKGVPQNIMDPKYQGKLEKQYQDMKMRAISNRSGGLGLQDAKVNQAYDLRKLVNKYYDPKTDTFNIPPSQHSELALGLARLISPTGQIGIELMHELRQGTGREALSKALIYAGADPTQVGGPTQNVARMFIDSVDRQGEVAEQLRDQYMQYIRDNAPTDLEPARKAKHDQGKLNSFNDFLSKSPDHLRQTAPIGGSYTAEKEARYQELLKKRANVSK